tara:strand:+ start:332 stop:1087 length:756 start_codon:yes stop_codon:yes gene_type:complete
MPARKKKMATGVGAGMTAKQMKRKKPYNSDMMVPIEPITDNQKKAFTAYENDKNLFLYGCAGTGKTFITLYMALKQVLDPLTPYNKVVLVRSLVSTREIGFLPGDHEDKSALYQIPYKNMVKYMFELPTDNEFEMLWGNLKTQESVTFWSTSFIRGTTLDDSIIIVDESQNLNFHELDSIMTRCGENTRIIFCGDVAQTDLIKTNEKNGILDFQKIIQRMPEFECLEFNINDIVRSGLVKSYLICKIEAGM